MFNLRSANQKGLVSISVFKEHINPTVLVKNDSANKDKSNVKDNNVWIDMTIHTVERPPGGSLTRSFGPSSEASGTDSQRRRRYILLKPP
jgi:hypothetical protein